MIWSILYRVACYIIIAFVIFFVLTRFFINHTSVLKVQSVPVQTMQPIMKGKTVEWKDYVFSVSPFLAPKIELYIQNIKTSEKKTLYSEKNLNKYLEVGNLVVIEDVIFFDIQDPRGVIGSYYIDLSPKIGTPVKFDSPGEIKLWGGKYLATRTVGGDGCAHQTYYSAFNLKTKQSKLITIEIQKCDASGNKVFILDDQIISAHSVGDGKDYTETSHKLTYTHVNSIDGKEPYKEIELISKASMPKNIADIYYDRPNNRLLLDGPTEYVTDLNGRVLSLKNTEYVFELKNKILSNANIVEKKQIGN